jgi:hypothetical protein
LETGAALDAVVDAALALQLQAVSFWQCRLAPASAPALARLLGGSALMMLECLATNLLDAPAAAVLAAALRANATLTSLSLADVGVWRDAAAAAALLGALTGHASLRTLFLHANGVEDTHLAAAATLLGVLIAANAPALTELDVSWCDLGDDGLRPLFEVLPHNTHLRTLKAAQNNVSKAFARDVLLPAVRANPSLRCLDVGDENEEWESVSAREAMALVAQRASID